MTTPAFPILRALLSTPNADRWFTPWSPVKMDKLNAALETWFAARAAGAIDNPRFVEIKSSLSRAVEEAWGALPRDNAVLQTLPEADRNALDSLPSPNLSNLAGRQRRIEKASACPMRTDALALLEELKPLAESYAFLRAHAVKRVVRTEEEREATKFVPPSSSSAAVAQARVVLEKAIDRTYQGLVDRYQATNRRILSMYLTGQETALADPARAGKGYSPAAHYTLKVTGMRRVANPGAVAFLSQVLECTYPDDGSYPARAVYSASPATYEKSDALALKEATDVRDQFLFKNLAKLTPLLEAKGDSKFASIRELGEFNLERLEGDFQVDFTDGSRFRLHNAVVFVINQYETSFCRFPTTFHDVLLPGGHPMPSPSEERMHEVFAPATSPWVDLSSEAKAKPRHR